MKKTTMIILTVILTVFIASCDKDNKSASNALDSVTAVEVISNYHEALKDGFQYAHEYLFFGEEYEYIRAEVSELPDKLIDFVIEDSRRINENLYEFTVLSEFDLIRPGMYARTLSFVGRISGNDYVIQSVDFIPDDLKENLDPDLYDHFYSNSYSDDSKAKEINGKPIVQPGDAEYGIIIDESDLLSD